MPIAKMKKLASSWPAKINSFQINVNRIGGAPLQFQSRLLEENALSQNDGNKDNKYRILLSNNVYFPASLNAPYLCSCFNVYIFAGITLMILLWTRGDSNSQ